jgi:putative salt-induced outer membrane protein YdiY
MRKRVELSAAERPRQWAVTVIVFMVAMLLVNRFADAQQPPPTCPCPPAPAAPPIWTGSAGFGLSMNRGNTDTTNLNLSFEATRDPKQKDIWKFQALYMRGDTSGEATADRFFAQARYQRNLNAHVFVVGELPYLRDRFKSIDYLIAPSGGIGYKVVASERTTLSADAGLGVKWEKNPGFDVDTSAVVTSGDDFEFKLSPTSSITQSFKALWDADDWGDALYTFSAGVAAALTTRSQLKITILDAYATEPPTAEVKKNDVAVLAAVVYKF